MGSTITDADIGFLSEHPNKWKEIQEGFSHSTKAQLQGQINDINAILKKRAK